MYDTPQKMIRAAASFCSGTMLSRVTGMLRDMAMAFAFGTDASLAAFLVAFRFSHLFRRLLGEGTLQSVFIPHFESLRLQTSDSRAFQLFIDLYKFLALLLAFLIFVGSFCLLTSQGYLSHEGEESALKEIVWLTFLMLPGLFFICLAGLNAAILQCEQSFFLPSVSPVAFNVCWIVGVFSLSSYSTSKAMPLLSFWIVAACFCQWLMTFPKVVTLLKKQNFSLLRSLTSSPLTTDLKALATPFFMGILGMAAAQINSACDAIFARYADSSGPAYLWYAIRLQQLPLALFGIALSGALLPPLTRGIKAGDTVRSQFLFQEAINYCLLLILPITCGLFIFAWRSIDLLYGYGDFGLDSIQGTTLSLWGYGFGLIPMCLLLIIAPVFYAKGDYKTPMQASVMAMILNVLLNALVTLKLEWGAESVAFSTGLCAWVNLFYLWPALGEGYQESFIKAGKKALSEMSLFLIVACFLAIAFSKMLPLGTTFLSKGGYLFLLAAVFGGCFIKILPAFKLRLSK